MPVPAPLTDPPPPASRLLEVLASLGRPVTVTASSATSPATTLHLARLLVAVAERHAISAELAMGAGDHDGHDVDDHQDTYDTATVRAAFERLALAHWRARRLTATVTTLRETMLSVASQDDTEDDPSGMAQMWGLASHTTIAADAILAVLAQLVTPPGGDTAAAAGRLDAATALLVRVGESAAGLRTAIGLDEPADDSRAV